MVVDFRKYAAPITRGDSPVNTVESFCFLGSLIFQDLNAVEEQHGERGLLHLWKPGLCSVEVCPDRPLLPRPVLQAALGSEYGLLLVQGGVVYSIGVFPWRRRSQSVGVCGPVLEVRLGGQTVVRVAAGPSHCGVVTEVGGVYMWGDNTAGQCGPIRKERRQGQPASERGCVFIPHPSPVRVVDVDLMPPSVVRLVELACGREHTLALSAQGEVWAWGSGCQLGLVTKTSSGGTPCKVEHLVGRHVIQVACGDYHSLALVQRLLPQNCNTQNPSQQPRQSQPTYRTKPEWEGPAEVDHAQYCPLGVELVNVTPNKGNTGSPRTRLVGRRTGQISSRTLQLQQGPRRSGNALGKIIFFNCLDVEKEVLEEQEEEKVEKEEEEEVLEEQEEEKVEKEEEEEVLEEQEEEKVEKEEEEEEEISSLADASKQESPEDLQRPGSSPGTARPQGSDHTHSDQQGAIFPRQGEDRSPGRSCPIWGPRSGAGAEGQRASWDMETTYTESLAGEEVVKITTGSHHSLALTAQSEVYSWGSNRCGQLGHDSLPVTVPHKAQMGYIHSVYSGGGVCGVVSDRTRPGSDQVPALHRLSSRERQQNRLLKQTSATFSLLLRTEMGELSSVLNSHRGDWLKARLTSLGVVFGESSPPDLQLWEGLLYQPLDHLLQYSQTLLSLASSYQPNHWLQALYQAVDGALGTGGQRSLPRLAVAMAISRSASYTFKGEGRLRGALYTGTWLAGRMHGRYASGEVYEGCFHDGQRNGYGMLKSSRLAKATSSIFIGQWVHDKKTGYGVSDDITRGEKYIGEWQGDQRQGVGVLLTQSGLYYQGSFRDHCMAGQGLLVTDDNTSFRGEFSEDWTINGKGLLCLPSGEVLEGVFSGRWGEDLKVSGTLSRPLLPRTGTRRSSRRSSSILPDWSYQGVFEECLSRLGCTSRGKPDQQTAWDHIAVTMTTGRRESPDLSRSQSRLLEGLEVIPQHGEPITASAYDNICRYLAKACATPLHPLGWLLETLVMAYRVTYVGVGCHPQLLHQAIAELQSNLHRILSVVRILFPGLPEEGGSISSSVCVVSSSTLLLSLLLPRVYPILFSLYCQGEGPQHALYWQHTTTLNLLSDQSLLSFLGVNRRFWPVSVSVLGEIEQVTSSTTNHCFSSAVEMLQQIGTVFTPSDKLQVIQRSFKTLTQEVKSLLGISFLWSMDDLFPLFLYVVLRARIRYLGAEVGLITDFMDPELIHGELGLMFTTLEACYLHIQQDDHDL
ncbi:unnamed protein product [Merluccius merluccius]